MDLSRARFHKYLVSILLQSSWFILRTIINWIILSCSSWFTNSELCSLMKSDYKDVIRAFHWLSKSLPEAHNTIVILRNAILLFSNFRQCSHTHKSVAPCKPTRLEAPTREAGEFSSATPQLLDYCCADVNGMRSTNAFSDNPLWKFLRFSAFARQLFVIHNNMAFACIRAFCVCCEQTCTEGICLNKPQKSFELLKTTSEVFSTCGGARKLLGAKSYN